MKLSFKIYACCSINALLALILVTLAAHESLYYGLHFLCTERISVAIFTNFVLMTFFGLSRLFVSIFLGPLRDFEVEQVFEVGRAFLLDTVMFLVLSSPTIDDEEVSIRHILQFVGFVVVLKLFHVIAQTRVTHLFESGTGRGRQFARLLGLLVMLSCVDVIAVGQFFKWSRREASLYLWLFFECVGMTATSFMNFTKFCLRYVDHQTEGGWPWSGTGIFFLNVISDVLSLGIFLIFMIVFIISHPSRLPIHMTSDIFLVGKALFVKLRSFQRYRQLVKEMAKRFPEATISELESAETCIICRDSLYVGSRKLPCGHIFHVECLKAWFVQQQSCPTCRTNVFSPPTAEQTQDTSQSELDQRTQQESTLQPPIDTDTTRTAFSGNSRVMVFTERPTSRRLNSITRGSTLDIEHHLSALVEHLPHQPTHTSESREENMPRFQDSSAGSRPNSCVSLRLNSPHQCVYIVYRKVDGQILSSTCRGQQTLTRHRPVSNFFRRMLCNVFPSLNLNPSPHIQCTIQTHIPQIQRSCIIHPRKKKTARYLISSYHDRHSMNLRNPSVPLRSRGCSAWRYCPQHSRSTRISRGNFTAQKTALKESLDQAVLMSAFFQQQSLYWLGRLKTLPPNGPCPSDDERESPFPQNLFFKCQPRSPGAVFSHKPQSSESFRNEMTLGRFVA